MKKLQRFLSAVLCIVMIAAMAIPAAASGIVTSPAPATTGTLSVKEILKEFDKDDYTVVEFGKSGKPALAEYQGGSGVLAEHTVYNGVNATKLVVQNIAWASFAKSHIAFGRNSVPEFAEYDYMVVKYASVSDKAYRLGVGGWGEGDGVYFEVPAGETGWTTSGVLTISAECKAVAATKRSIISNSTTAETYIGDIVFFKNKADAEEYAKWAPIYLDPNGDVTLRRIQKREENWETIKLIMMLIGSAVAERMELKPEPKVKPFEGIDEEAYSVVEFGEGGRIGLAEFNYGSGIMAEHTSYNGVVATKLKAENVSWAAYSKSAIVFGNNVSEFKNYDYMVVRYASESDSEYKLSVGGWGNFESGVQFVVPAGYTDWAVSDVLTISDLCKAQSASKRHIVSTSGSAETYIADIVFFENEDDAKQYVKQWRAYYADKLNPDVLPLDPINNYPNSVQYTITADNIGSGAGQHAKWNIDPFVYPTYYGIAASKNVMTDYLDNFTRDTDAVPGRAWKTGATANTGARFNLGSGSDPDVSVYRYMVVNYVSTCDNEHQLGFFVINNGKRNFPIDTVPAKQTGWATTAPVDLVAIEEAAYEGADPATVRNFLTNVKGREIMLFSTGKNASGMIPDLKIGSVVFFADLDDANAYREEAAAYYTYMDNLFSKNELIADMEENAEGGVFVTRFARQGSDYRLQDDHTTIANSVYAGVPCVKISSGNATGWWQAINGNYVISTSNAYLNGATPLTSADYKYAVVTYATTINQKADFKMYHWGTPNTTMMVDDISVSNGKWVTSGVIDVDGNWRSRFNGNKVIWGSSTKATEGDIYVHSIIYFTNKDDAEAYIAAAPAYYNGEEYNNPIYWISVAGEGKVYTQSFAKDGLDYANAGEYTDHANTTYGANNTPCLEIESTGKVGWNSGKGGFISYVSTPTTHKTLLGGNEYPYAVVTYAYDPAGTTAPVQLLLHPWYGTAPKVVIAEDMSISNGKWVTSGVIDDNVKEWGSGTAAQKMQITTNADSHNPYYIHSINYFSSKADAEYYVANAPAYYNGEDIVDPTYWLSVLGEGEVHKTSFEKVGTTWATSIDYATKDDGTPTYSDATHKGVPCVALEAGTVFNYAPSTGIKTYVSFTDKPTGFGTVLAEGQPYKYAVVTYATKAESQAFLKMNTWGTPSPAVFANDISVSKGKWVTSDIVEIGLPMAVNAAKKMVVFSDLTEKNEPIYIREIMFFESLADADYYQTNAPEYYNRYYGK